MQQRKTSAQLKQIARGMMLGKYRQAISILLATDLIITTLSLFMSVTAGNSMTGIIISFLISFILTLLSCILLVGQCAFFLNIACGRNARFSNLFEGFKVYPDKTIICQLIVYGLSLVAFVPAIIAALFAGLTERAELFLVFCICCVFGIVLFWWVNLAYSQWYYLLLDFPECKALELLKMSRKLMRKNMLRMLYIQVSFIPITLLGIISLGLGLLFVTPYKKMTYTLFYLDLIHQN